MILKKLKCAIVGHQYRTHQKFTPITRRVVCDRCHGDWGMHDGVRAFVQWSSEFEAMYEAMGATVQPVIWRKP